MCAVGRAGAPGGEPIDIPVLAEEVGIAPKPLSGLTVWDCATVRIARCSACPCDTLSLIGALSTLATAAIIATFLSGTIGLAETALLVRATHLIGQTPWRALTATTIIATDLAGTIGVTDDGALASHAVRHCRWTNATFAPATIVTAFQPGTLRNAGRLALQ